MHDPNFHSFSIPVMGTSFTVDSPLKVARFGISSVISIMSDELCELMRQYYSKIYHKSFNPVPLSDYDYRAKRVTAYLDLLNEIVNEQIQKLKQEEFTSTTDLTKYFELLDEQTPLKQTYLKMLSLTASSKKTNLQEELKKQVKPGSIDVNIMTKVDNQTYDKKRNQKPSEYSDALSLLRGYANSNLTSSVIFSASFNLRLYSYVAEFPDFYPDENGFIKKKIVLKVSDYRSSITQGKIFAKKGLWISEHRIESGLNCGGHAFATEGHLLGPILEEFKNKREELKSFLFELYKKGLVQKNKKTPATPPATKFTAQGGIGTAAEHKFLKRYYNLDTLGWGSPFLLCPEASNLDDHTLHLLAKSKREDFYISHLSPLGVRFNSVKNTLSDLNRAKKVAAGTPGSACPKGHLAFNTEYTQKNICVASAFYQKKKLADLKNQNLSEPEYQKAYQKIIHKACLCEDLTAPALLKYQISTNRPQNPTVCPGPNIAYFTKIVSLAEILGHIYGKTNLLSNIKRPNLFIQELKLYLDYIKEEIENTVTQPTAKQINYLTNYARNLLKDIDYYKSLIPNFVEETIPYQENMEKDLLALESELQKIIASNHNLFPELA
ncbi:hypothetical protein HOG75_05540 [bacterium]|nr:hypothetical protein [bacterium]